MIIIFLLFIKKMIKKNLAYELYIEDIHLNIWLWNHSKWLNKFDDSIIFSPTPSKNPINNLNDMDNPLPLPAQPLLNHLTNVPSHLALDQIYAQLRNLHALPLFSPILFGLLPKSRLLLPEILNLPVIRQVPLCSKWRPGAITKSFPSVRTHFFIIPNTHNRATASQTIQSALWAELVFSLSNLVNSST